MTRLILDISDEAAAKLERAPRPAVVSPSELVGIAVEHYVDLDETHRAEIEAGLAETEAGHFATDAEMKVFFLRAARTGA
ncbi:hypothetical protein [Rhizobium sp. TRM95796]|uniref:hypothetical protein n=1 Tax=Rhizobium sp. TRM95796 TaxID=2979862 RepID=UPI0021E7B8C2|nr:hypothetical protein [Rhizobium sp. TRM95796]MCV3766569.1 hypothetical protein [Rhizobium sp. TRM95796]